jgi:hypothetical protein
LAVAGGLPTNQPGSGLAIVTEAIERQKPRS